MIDGEQYKQIGMDRVWENEAAEWKENAMAWIRKQTVGSLLTAEDLTNAVGRPTHHHNAVGPLFRHAARLGLIHKAPFVGTAKRASRHAAMMQMWRRVGERCPQGWQR